MDLSGRDFILALGFILLIIVIGRLVTRCHTGNDTLVPKARRAFESYDPSDRYISCTQVCSINNPGAQEMCAQGKGQQSVEACKIFRGCVDECRAKQAQSHRIGVNPEMGPGSRYSHLLG